MLISHKKFEATYLKHHKEKEPKRFFSPLFCWPNKKEHAAQQNATTRCGEKSCPIQEKREVTTIIYFNPIQPNKKSSKNIFTVLSFHPFCNQPRKWPTTCRQVLLWSVFTHFVILLAMFRCVVATIVVVFLFIVFYCFLYKLLCLFFSNIGAPILNPLHGKKMCL